MLIYNSTGTVVERFSPNPRSDEILFIESNCKKQLFHLCVQTKRPQIISSEINQLWAGVPIFDGDNITRMIVLGPVHTSDVSKRLAVDYVRSPFFTAQHRAELLDALEQTPVCPYVDLTKLVSLIYSLIYREELDVSSSTISGLVNDDVTFADGIHFFQERQDNAEDNS